MERGVNMLKLFSRFSCISDAVLPRINLVWMQHRKLGQARGGEQSRRRESERRRFLGHDQRCKDQDMAGIQVQKLIFELFDHSILDVIPKKLNFYSMKLL